MSEVIYEMSRKRLGMTTVEDNGKLSASSATATCAVCSNTMARRPGEDSRRSDESHPRTITADELAVRALDMMEEKKITSLVAVDASGTIQGVVHLHDLWETELI